MSQTVPIELDMATPSSACACYRFLSQAGAQIGYPIVVVPCHRVLSAQYGGHLARHRNRLRSDRRCSPRTMSRSDGAGPESALSTRWSRPHQSVAKGGERSFAPMDRFCRQQPDTSSILEQLSSLAWLSPLFVCNAKACVKSITDAAAMNLIRR